MMHSSLVSSLQASPTELNLHNIKIYMRSFKIYGIWPQASKQAYTRTCTMQSHYCGARSGSPQLISVLVNGNVQTISACKELYYSITFILLWHSKSEGVLGTHFSLMHGSPDLLDNLENP